MPDIEQELNLATKLKAIKKLERFRGQYGWRDYPQPNWYESVADHSWRLAILVLLLAPKLSKPLNVERALRIALVHDIPEMLTGDHAPISDQGTGEDTHAFNQGLETQKHEEEKTAAASIFAQLPSEQGKIFYELCIEYMENSSFEARVVRALDKVEATLQVLEQSEGHLYPDQFAFCTKYCRKYANVDPTIHALTEALIQRIQAAYQPFHKEA